MLSVVGAMGEEAPRYRAIAARVLVVCVSLVAGFGAAAATALGRFGPQWLPSAHLRCIV